MVKLGKWVIDFEFGHLIKHNKYTLKAFTISIYIGVIHRDIFEYINEININLIQNALKYDTNVKLDH